MAKTIVARIEKVPAEIRAADALRQAIVDGVISPGSRITESDLSEQMQLSRATIRAALHQLSVEGLTSLKRYAGWSVVSLSAADVRELYTVRSTIERLSARLVAESLNDMMSASIKKSLSVLERQCANGNWQKIAAADFEFHKQIVVCAGNGRLTSQYAMLESQIRMYIRSLDTLFNDAATIMAQHEAIAKAILARDTGAAGDLAEAHNLVDGEILARHLAAQDLKLAGSAN